MKILSVFGQLSTVILGGVGVLSLASNIIQIEEHLNSWLMVWQYVVHGFWGKIFSWVSFDIPKLAFDYLTVGMIVSTNITRLDYGWERDHMEYNWISEKSSTSPHTIWNFITLNFFEKLSFFVLYFAFWPIALVVKFKECLDHEQSLIRVNEYLKAPKNIARAKAEIQKYGVAYLYDIYLRDFKRDAPRVKRQRIFYGYLFARESGVFTLFDGFLTFPDDSHQTIFQPFYCACPFASA